MPVILFVCEGNVCRSPLAAALLARTWAASELSMAIGSAGTRALVGSPVDASTAELAARAHLDLSGHRARQLDRELASSATLLLAATRRIRSAAVAIHPAAVQYAFTVRQVGRLLGRADGPISSATDPGRRLDDLTAYLIRNRGLHPVGEPSMDDIVDPYGRSLEIHQEAAAQIAPAISALSRALGGPPASWLV